MIRAETTVNAGINLPPEQRFQDSSLSIRGDGGYPKVVSEDNSHGTTVWARTPEGVVRGVTVLGGGQSAFEGILSAYRPGQELRTRARATGLSILRK